MINAKILMFIFCAFTFPRIYLAEDSIIFNAAEECLEESSEEFASKCFFQFPILLEKAKQEKLKVVLLIDKNLNGYGPLDKKSLSLEPQRVAVTWATVYKNFFDVDVKISTCLSTNMSNLIPININLTEYENRIIDPGLANDPDKKRFLITGGAGFIGSHMTKKILDMGHQVIIIDNYSCCRRDNLQDYADNKDLKIVEHDVTKPFDIVGRLDYVVHLASQPSPKYYYKRPIETLHSGLIGTKLTLELAKDKKAKFLLASTSEVYGDPEVNPQSESYAGNVSYVGPRSQYDESKRGAEVLAKLYFEKYGVDVRIARIFNTYGPYMMLNDGRVVTNFIHSILDKKPLTIYGSGNQTRSFSFVSDTVDGLLKLLFCQDFRADDIYSRVFNIGNDSEMTINDLAVALSKISKNLFGYQVDCNYINNFDYTDPRVRQPDLRKSKDILGYKTNISLEDGLSKTILYFVN